jgi:hypothetical protein
MTITELDGELSFPRRRNPSKLINNYKKVELIRNY